MLDFDGTRKARQRDAALAGGVLLLALILFFLPEAYQDSIRRVMRSTVLQPFLPAQETVAAQRSRTIDVTRLRAQRDSLAALVSAQATLAEENRRLRDLQGLRARAGASFIPAEVLRVGLTGAESTFLISVGSDDGVRVDAPVIAPEGLIGRVVSVDRGRAQVMDWTHPQFKVGAMTADGSSYGIVSSRRGRFREEDYLALEGAPFHSDIQPGRLVVTSGRGSLYPRGVPIGVVIGIEDADTGWRKSYMLRPAARSEALTHVLVGVASAADLSSLWNVPPVPDTERQSRDTVVRRDTAGSPR